MANIINVMVVKGKEAVPLDLEKLSDAAYAHLMELGAKAFLNSRMSKITKANIADETELKAEAMTKAAENVEKLYNDDFKRASGAKASKLGREVKTEAMRLAKALVKDTIKKAGGKPSHFEPSEITQAAKDYLEGDQGADLIELAKANIEARGKVAAGEIDKLSTITASLKESPKRVKAAKEKAAKNKAEGLSAKQAGMTTKAKKGKSAQANA